LTLAWFGRTVRAHEAAGKDAVELCTELWESISRACDVPIADFRRVDRQGAGLDPLASAEVLTDLEIRLDLELPVYALRRLVEPWFQNRACRYVILRP
jgi:hypothetical protein